MIRLKHILEQTVIGRDDVIRTAYNRIVTASAGLGTDPDAIVAAIGLLKTPTEFAQLLTLFKNKKTGYSNFVAMINKEYDRFNYNDIVKLINKLKSTIGVESTFVSGKNKLGQSFFLGKFQITYIPSDNKFKLPIIKINSACKTKWNTALPKAVAFWRNWLKDPITREKVKNNWADKKYAAANNTLTVADAFDSYEDLLSNLKLIFYDNTMAMVGNQRTIPNAYAFVSGDDAYGIYVNCSKNDPDVYGTLIHEIQHIIYDIKPLNPAKKIRDAFVTSKTVKQTTHQIQTSLPAKNTKISSYVEIIKNSATKYGIDPKYLKFWKKNALNNPNSSSDPYYICRETEKMSNIMSIRKTLNIKPGGVITYNMLKPYITLQKTQTDMDWFLMCWAINNFTDINKMLSKINQLAANQSKTNKTPGSNLA